MPSSPRDDAGDGLIDQLERGRRAFLALVEPVRAELHRYCARMTGSLADGEDVVQETLAAAHYELSQMNDVPPLRPWLFRIAHNRAIDHWRREQLRRAEPLEAALDVADDAAREPEQALAQQQAVRAAIAQFLALPPLPRACVVLKDVLGHSLEEIAAELSISLPAVKAALHRGRTALAAAATAAAEPPPPVSPALQRYAALFNARDFDGVKALLAHDVQLDLVSRRKLAGAAVATYFGNYEKVTDWWLVPAWLDGREVLAVRSRAADERPPYFIVLAWRDGRVQTIRDYRHVGYIALEASFLPAG